MKKKKSKPEHHHYIPRFNLEYFSDHDLIWVYDSYENSYSNFPIKEVAVKHNFYTVTNRKGKKYYAIEEYLSQVEAVSKPIIEKLNKRESISDDEKFILAEYLYLQMYRTPKNIRRSREMVEKITKQTMSITASNKEYFDRTMKKVEKKHKDLPKVDNESIRQDLINKNYNIHIPKEMVFKFMMENLTDMVNMIFISDWKVLHTPHEYMFLTSDDPYTQIQTRELTGIYKFMVGIGVVGTEITIALTPHTCVLILPRDGSISHINVNREAIKNINLRTAYNCDRFLFSKNEALLKRIVKRTEIWKHRPIKELVSVSY